MEFGTDIVPVGYIQTMMMSSDHGLESLSHFIQYAADRMSAERVSDAILFHDVEDRFQLESAEAASVIFAAREFANARMKAFH